MPNERKDAESALQKLGQRIRTGWAKKHPISQRSAETVRTAVREQWEVDQQSKRTVKPPTPSKSKSRKPPEPER
jgi:hypothetical protein